MLACLARTRYDAAWDCAAGTGHLALAVAARCGRILATDASPGAVAIASRLVADRTDVTCAVSALPDLPPGASEVDLTLVTEVLHYLTDADRSATITRIASQRGEVVSVHWRHLAHDAHVSGADAADQLGAGLAAAGWWRGVRHDDADFVVEGWLAPS